MERTRNDKSSFRSSARVANFARKLSYMIKIWVINDALYA